MREFRVLLIEDNDVDAAVFRRYVEAMDGYTVTRVGSLEEAEERVEELGTSWFHLVAVDLTLPDAFDLEAIWFARTHIPQAVCVAVTARNPEEVDERALRAGAADLLVKGQMNARGVQRAISHAVERNELVRRQLESERNLRSVLAAWNDALLVVDEEGHVLFRNDAAASFADSVVMDVDGRRRLRFSIAPGEVLQTEVAVASGTASVPVEVRAWRITWADGPATVVSLRDRRAERAAERARDLAELGRGALKDVHDIGNRVTAVLAGLHDLRGLGEGLPDEHRARLDDIVHAMSRSVDQIANVVRSSRGKATEVRQRRLPVELSALVRSCCQDLRPVLAAAAGLRLRLEPGIEVLADPSQLTRTIDNLLRNAAEAVGTEAPGEHEIRVRVHQEGDVVQLDVEDTGPGVPAGLADRIFEEGVTTKDEGTGLGLSSVRRIVQEHGGTITLETPEDGIGSRFRVTLPARATRPTGVRILLLEDQADVARANQRLLGDRFRVVIARDGQQALDRIATDTDFHAVLCDLDMPGMDGRAFYESLVVTHPDLASRVVFCTGGAASPDLEAFLGRSDRPVLPKPIDLSVAIPLIESFAARAP